MIRRQEGTGKTNPICRKEAAGVRPQRPWGDYAKQTQFGGVGNSAKQTQFAIAGVASVPALQFRPRMTYSFFP